MQTHARELQVYLTEDGRAPFSEWLVSLRDERAMPTNKPYQPELIQSLRAPRHAAAYLNAALEEGDPEVFLLALRNVAEAQGGIAQLADRANLNRENLYRMLSECGNPELRSVDAILHALGFRLAIELEEGPAPVRA